MLQCFLWAGTEIFVRFLGHKECGELKQAEAEKEDDSYWILLFAKTIFSNIYDKHKR